MIDGMLSFLKKHLKGEDCGAVLEIDLRKYFNTIPHEPLIRMLKEKISDERFLHLIIKLLKAPILNGKGVPERNQTGSPQGSILSPVIANIYLHHVLDSWFVQLNNSQYGGSAAMVRYADDAVFTFRSLAEAESFRVQLEIRLKQFGISIHEGKTKAMVSGSRQARRLAERGEQMPGFTFLGFLHVWGKSLNKKRGIWFWRVKRRTDPSRFRKKLADMKTYIRANRHKKGLLLKVKNIVLGYLNYFAINDNGKRVHQFIFQVKRLLFKWLNRRSQKRSLNWKTFTAILKKIEFPERANIRNLFFNAKPTGRMP